MRSETLRNLSDGGRALKQIIAAAKRKNVHEKLSAVTSEGLNSSQATLEFHDQESEVKQMGFSSSKGVGSLASSEGLKEEEKTSDEELLRECLFLGLDE